MTKGRSYIRGIFFTAAGGIGWGVSGVCSQYLFIYYHMNSAWLTAIRMVFSGIILLGISLPKHRRAIVGILKDPTDRLWLLVFSIAGLLLCQYAFLSAIQYSNSGTATVLQSLNVVLLTAFLCLKNHVLPEQRRLFSIILAVAGVYLISTNGNPYNMVLSPYGLFWGIMAALGVVFYTLLSQNIVVKWGNLVVTGWGMLIGGIVLSVLIHAWSLPVFLDVGAFIVIVIIVVVGTAGAFAAFLQGVNDIGPVNATLIASLEPVTATVISAFWLHTKFNMVDILGFCLILATVFLSVRRKGEKL